MDKYYTPEIKEFYVGFEFEENQIDSNWKSYGWENKTVDIDFNFKLASEYIGLHRVKYLSKEDIESLGFISSNVIDVLKEEAEFIKGFEKNTYILYIQEDKKLVIYNQKEYDISNKITGNWTEEILFKGYIKNKSELRKLFKMLNID